ncbi:hypothetical protein HAX54_029077 [Datura stramonium]|uniref:protein-serine/threonine phosphatase n=1 Tax=Datura stramonium TaxID=4076 RepID=A0ABS8V5R2_DATST|nr:hypothetical protein [Datura stramonium]
MPVFHCNVCKRLQKIAKMVSKGNDNSSEKCRSRRQHRIRLRRLHLQDRDSSSSNSQRRQAGAHSPETTDPSSSTSVMPPVQVGSMTIKGRRRTMEDEVSIRQNLCAPEINARRPIDFFAIYDGHGGPHVSALCRERLHVLLEEELMRRRNNTYMRGSTSSDGQQEWEAAWKALLKRCFLRLDQMASTNCDCGNQGYSCGCPHDYTLGLTGSTAVVAILTDDTIIVANCGDSRAVLSRNERAVALSFDHKPNKRDEYARIVAYGGRVIYSPTPRVEGILAMSRAIASQAWQMPFNLSSNLALPNLPLVNDKRVNIIWVVAHIGATMIYGVNIYPESSHSLIGGKLIVDSSLGDNYLKPYVIPEPEITFIKREAEDECMILASDGLWDVISNEMACQVARECLRREAIISSQSASAAALLTRLAMGRNSSDNISVIVVDLKRNHVGG